MSLRSGALDSSDITYANLDVLRLGRDTSVQLVLPWLWFRRRLIRVRLIDIFSEHVCICCVTSWGGRGGGWGRGGGGGAGGGGVYRKM